MEAMSQQIFNPKTRRGYALTTLVCFAMLIPSLQALNGQITPNEIDGSSFLGHHSVSALFLTITPDARSAGIGEVGIASEPDINSQHWNPAKYAFIDGKGGVSANYTPWLTNLLPNMHLGYISGYYRINDKNVLSSSFRYLSLGKVTFTNVAGIMDFSYHYELAGDVAYSRKFTDHLSGGIALRYIHSDVAPRQNTADGAETRAGRSVAGDLSIYYQNRFGIGTKDARWAIGANISNIGIPISYHTNSEYKTPIPTYLRIGSKVQIKLNKLNSISLMADVNKLMVPTQPVYDVDTVTGNLMVVRGKEVPESVLTGMIQSFSDAPGFLKSDRTYSVLQEEISEINFSVGAEYWYDNTLAVRLGYHHEHQAKGNRRFFTMGIGGKYKFLSADISYLMTVNGQNSPLANTFRFTLAAEFGKTSY
jgi:hypothetical protein